MSRLDFFTIAIVAVCIGALAILVVRVVKLTGEGSNELATTENLGDYDKYFEDDNTTSDFNEQEEEAFNSEESDNSLTTDNTSEEENNFQAEVVEQDTEIPEIDDAPASFDQSSSSENTPSTSTSTAVNNFQPQAGTTDGAFMVIAGSFSVKENAEAYADKIRNMGYTNVSIAPFNKGKINAVLVDRYDTESEAQAAVRELKKEHEVNAYVQKKVSN